MNEKTLLKASYVPLDVESDLSLPSDRNSKVVPTSPTVQRCVLLVLLLVCLIFLHSYVESVRPAQDLHYNSSFGYSIYDECKPGVFGNQSLLPFLPWKPFEASQTTFPLYYTHSINEVHPEVQYVVISQHGNLRNANNYFCGAIDTLQDTFGINVKGTGDLKSIRDVKKLFHEVEDVRSPNNFMIISPQFLIDGDLCWDAATNQLLAIRVSEGVTCGHMIWTSEGWKDGLKSVNYEASGALYSYDIFNLLIEQLSDPTHFPNLKKIVLFGFSAGGQTLLRYSMWPQYVLKNPKIQVKFVVGDLSTYLYMDERRPFTNGTEGFGVPDASWLRDEWKVDVNTDANWISGWDNSCQAYNDWRFGLNNLQGYYQAVSNAVPDFKTALVAAFPTRNVHFMIGLNDSENCKLHAKQPCEDNELATYCQAMLQGENRLDRFLKYRDYLQHIYHSQLHKVQYVQNVNHDPVAMLRSDDAKCAVFGFCNANQSTR